MISSLKLSLFVCLFVCFMIHLIFKNYYFIYIHLRFEYFNPRQVILNFGWVFRIFKLISDSKI